MHYLAHVLVKIKLLKKFFKLKYKKVIISNSNNNAPASALYIYIHTHTQYTSLSTCMLIEKRVLCVVMSS